jgi:hypothetical protein
MRKVPVDLSMLPVALESHGENQWYLDLETGDVIPVFDGPQEEEKIEDAPERFLLIEAADTSSDDFRVMEDFVAGLPPGEAKRDLERVLRRAKPFRNFREALRDWPEIEKQWFAVRDRRSEEAARAWLADHEIEPVPRPPYHGNPNR